MTDGHHFRDQMDSTILKDSRAAAWEINSVAEAHRTQLEKLEDKFAKGLQKVKTIDRGKNEGTLKDEK